MKMTPNERPTGTCWLCEARDVELLSGHVTPRFVTHWLKRTSATGKLESALVPGVPMQDGIRADMFCRTCEQILSKDEGLFAEHAFFPRHDEGAWSGFDYEEWLLRFAVGVALRVAFGHFDETRTPKPGPGSRILRDRAVPAWRAFLLGEAAHSGDYDFHLILTDYVTKADVPLAERIQFYLMRGVDQTYVWSRSGTAALFALIPGFVFWVPLAPRKQTGWHGTRIHRAGRIESQSQALGAPVFDFMNERAQALTELSNEITASRLDSRLRRFEKASDRLPTSKSADAWHAQQGLRAPPGRPRSDLQLPPAEALEASRELLRRRKRRRRRSS